MCAAMIGALYIFYGLWRDNRLDAEEERRSREERSLE